MGSTERLCSGGASCGASLEISPHGIPNLAKLARSPCMRASSGTRRLSAISSKNGGSHSPKSEVSLREHRSMLVALAEIGFKIFVTRPPCRMPFTSNVAIGISRFRETSFLHCIVSVCLGGTSLLPGRHLTVDQPVGAGGIAHMSGGPY